MVNFVVGELLAAWVERVRNSPETQEREVLQELARLTAESDPWTAALTIFDAKNQGAIIGPEARR